MQCVLRITVLLLQPKTVNELEQIFGVVSDILETTALMSDPLNARSHVIQELESLRKTLKISPSSGRKSDGKRDTIKFSENITKGANAATACNSNKK